MMFWCWKMCLFMCMCVCEWMTSFAFIAKSSSIVSRRRRVIGLILCLCCFFCLCGCLVMLILRFDCFNCFFIC